MHDLGSVERSEHAFLRRLRAVDDPDLAAGRHNLTDRAIRDFGDDAGAVLALLREHRDGDRL